MITTFQEHIIASELIGEGGRCNTVLRCNVGFVELFVATIRLFVSSSAVIRASNDKTSQIRRADLGSGHQFIII